MPKHHRALHHKISDRAESSIMHVAATDTSISYVDEDITGAVHRAGMARSSKQTLPAFRSKKYQFRKRSSSAAISVFRQPALMWVDTRVHPHPAPSQACVDRCDELAGRAILRMRSSHESVPSIRSSATRQSLSCPSLLSTSRCALTIHHLSDRMICVSPRHSALFSAGGRMGVMK